MRTICYSLILFLACLGCAKQPSLPTDSKFNVTASLNDTSWYGTGKVLRLRNQRQDLKKVKKFNLVIFTDIDYNGFGSYPNPKTKNGCAEPECTKSQSLVIYNIPLKKRQNRIDKLDRSRQFKNEYASFSYIGNAGGLMKKYVYQHEKPGWIRVTRFDKAAGIVEGRFEIAFSEDTTLYNRFRNGAPPVARFSNGLFRIKITDVLLR
ncbi:hypothetical protein [Dyadobacter luticola]|uniref:Lipoprotein n=1 Tax=Dyadobacter luticola TaxID=1979387 RepID=A0A5R9L535_9BACT|nr:hypothetical protein [Dyadobacter luticola]TLV03390.1 hypothetical protein FEN17_07220 [Dyadobacter luticola]